jgi:2-keto-4-pentenoate hydratase/2-oxohepta-3-ene-1,7-dioic acid hydratase in catechol pathway
VPPSIAAAPREPLTLDDIARLRRSDVESLPRVPDCERLGPPVAGCGKIICVGLNYRDHARESRMEVPREPVLFMKATSALSGPEDEIRMPPGASKLDWEVELAVVIGRECRDVPEHEARSHVAGYCVMNDVSERAFQLEGTGQWVKGKSADTFAPLGPWLVTPDELPNPQDRRIWLSVNGISRQESSTRHMIFGVDALISYVSRFMSLQPGDVLATGTPPGVALGMEPPAYLRPGDVLELGVDGLGRQRQVVTGAAPTAAAPGR